MAGTLGDAMAIRARGEVSNAHDSGHSLGRRAGGDRPGAGLRLVAAAPAAAVDRRRPRRRQHAGASTDRPFRPRRPLTTFLSPARNS